MVALLVALALALAPWAHPLQFHPLPGWSTGASGNTHSVYVGHGIHVRTPLESAAWIASGVRYRDPATADPPNSTLAHLPAGGVIVWAVIYSPSETSQAPLRLDLAHARHFACCEAASVTGGEYELTGIGPGRAYSTIVRIYFGSHPTAELRAKAQRALDQLELPSQR